MKNNWEYTEIDAVELIDDVKAGKVTIPSFQRGAVWKTTQSKMLVDSIKKGFPFGSILIYSDSLGNRQLIDGLQRCLTIYDFISNPAAYFDVSDIDETAINEIISLSKLKNSIPTIRSSISNEIRNWIIDKHSTMESVLGMQYRDLADEIAEKFPSLKGHEKEVATFLQPMMRKFQSICKSLVETKIPALVYKGSPSNLPDIFERINKQGTNLNKYQIFAASWTSDKIDIIENELFDLVDIAAKRYESLGGSGRIKVDNYDPIKFKASKQLNVFEIGHSFGKLLMKKYPNLFGFDKNSNDISGLGFNVINACLLKKTNEMPSLNSNLLELGSNKDINIFLKQIILVTDFANEILAQFTLFKGNKRKTDYFIPHTELQIISIIAQIYKYRFTTYKIDEDNKITDVGYLLNESSINWKSNRSQFKKHIKAYYISDILTNAWKGTGDKKLDDIVLEKHSYYFMDYGRENFIKELEIWYQKDKTNRNERQKVANPGTIEKILLNVLYANEFSALQQIDSSKYDIEHLCTKELMKKILHKRIGLSLPISSFGNLCLLPEYNNRSKKDKIIYEDKKYLGKLSIEELEHTYTFTTKEDFDFLSCDFDNDLFKTLFHDFIDRRFEIMKEKIVNSIFNP